ncbi:hypothetical protein [Clostridium sp. CF012]|uniref:hypothetical protein n=1 Tax=Clostridium sp. CF012 TaxID=2843319 RepID=UPI001C0D59E9|nr:hypothetical protein [Clostridium sp. CF012]MBU3144129.1 hypothetical protein [Clostridium sp. CF012]
MYLVTTMIFLLSYSISYAIFHFISSKLNVKKWFKQNYMRKIIAVVISFIIYIVGTMLSERFNIVGNYNTILKGILYSIVVSTAVGVVSKVSKIRKVDK